MSPRRSSQGHSHGPHPGLLSAIVVAVVGAVSLAGCAALGPVGPTTEESHDVSAAVHGVRLETSGDVTVRVGDAPGLTIRAAESVHERLTVDEENGILVLGSEGVGPFGTVRYTLTVTSLDELRVDGSGDIDAAVVDAPEVTLGVEGSGDIDVADLTATAVDVALDGSGNVRVDELEADTVTVALDGSGDIVLSGVATRGDVRAHGSGNASLDDLEFEDVVVELDGSGDATVQASGTADARLLGSGDIRVLGRPRLTQRIDGSGDIFSD